MKERSSCRNGHSIGPAGRNSSGNCRECAREASRRWKEAHRFPGNPLNQWRGPVDRDALSDWASLVLGDFYLREREDPGLLVYPRCDRDHRVVGWPASGYGWPEDESSLIFLARILGAKLRSSGLVRVGR